MPSPTSVPAHPERLRAAERTENFPVALRLLPPDLRADLRAVYDVVRTIDDLGDELPERSRGERVAALHAFADDLAAVWSTGAPRSPGAARLVPAVRRRGLPREPFDRLLQANLADQEVTRYDDFGDLLGYCRLSAAPIGELVLHLFGAATPARLALADRVCAGLQVVEHLQDVGEDRRRGRVYLPQGDLTAAGVPESDLDAPAASAALRAVVLLQADRTAALLTAGRPLVADLGGWARIAVAGYLAGGLAALDAVRRTGGDVLGCTARTRRHDVARHAAVLLLSRGRPC
ncbi:squalene synthase HpnC [Geodermatophilus sp. SYSU D00758]